MKKKYVAELISSIFNPVNFFLIMPFLIVYRDTASGMSALKWELFSVIFIFLACFFIFFEKTRGIFSDWDLSIKEQRYKFYKFLIICAIVYIGTALFFKGILFSISLISLGIGVGILVLDFLNKYIKASVHVAVSSAFVITVSILYGQNFFILTFWIVPLLAWSRLFLKKHTKNEIIAGGILGSLITLSTFFIGKSL